MTVTTLAESTSPTNLYVTINPSDLSNYYSSTRVYTVGKANLKGINMPSCRKQNLSGDGTLVVSSEGTTGNLKEPIEYSPEKSGYALSGTYTYRSDTPAGTYTSVASLKYGYYWKNDFEGNPITNEEDKYKDITLNCKYPFIRPTTLTIEKVYAVDDKNKTLTDNTFTETEKNKSGTIYKSNYLKIKLVSSVPGKLITKDNIKFLGTGEKSITYVSSSLYDDKSNLLTSSGDNPNFNVYGKIHYLTLKANDIHDLIDIQITFTPENINEYATGSTSYKLKIKPTSLTVNIQKDGSKWDNSGMTVALMKQSDFPTQDKSKFVKSEVSSKSSITFKDIANGSYCLDVGKDSNQKDKNKRAAERITEFMKISKDCGNNATAGCMKANTTVNANSGHVGMYGSPETILDANTYSYITADGTSLAFDYASDSAFAVWIDIDGPNKGGFIVGSDVFPLTFLKDGLSIYSFAEFQYEEEFASWILMHGNMDYAKADASCKCPDGKTILDGVNNTTCK